MVSALIITFNEAHVLERCLKSVTWADEIVVVDSQSTDETKRLCLDPARPWAKKIRYFERPWSGFRDQRNFALDQAQNEWVFVIDSDEACSPELAQEIQNKVNQTPIDCSAYKVRRQEYFLGKQINYGIWNPSYQDRLFRKTGIRYVNDVHEYPKFTSAPQRIHEPIHHFPDFDIDKFLQKMNRYTTIEARDRYLGGQRTNFFRILTAFPAMFLKNYFYYKAYRDGRHGLVISLLEGLSRLVRHLKIWRLQNK